MTYESIITHNDFDGVVSAAICSYVFKIDSIKFAGPNNIARADLTITDGDIVCDLPYPLECGLWFDHHEGNLQELKYRNIDPKSIPGKFDLQLSCARVVYNYFKASQNLPGYFETLVDETDIIDGFHYNSIEDWRKETPAKIIDATIRSRKENYQLKRKYLHRLVLWLRNQAVEEVVAFSEIQQRYDQYKREEKEILEIIKQNSSFLPNDKANEIIIIDLTSFNRPPYIIKNLAYLLYPEALSVLEIKPIFRNQVKTTDLSISFSLSINLNHIEHNKDIGEIMRELNIGDGHKGAAAGTVYSKSKPEMLKQKSVILKKIFEIWQEQ